MLRFIITVGRNTILIFVIFMVSIECNILNKNNFRITLSLTAVLRITSKSWIHRLFNQNLESVMICNKSIKQYNNVPKNVKFWITWKTCKTVKGINRYRVDTIYKNDNCRWKSFWIKHATFFFILHDTAQAFIMIQDMNVFWKLTQVCAVQFLFSIEI